LTEFFFNYLSNLSICTRRVAAYAQRNQIVSGWKRNPCS